MHKSRFVSLHIARYSFGFSEKVALGCVVVSTGAHQGYTDGMSFAILPVNLTGRFSKNALTPSSLSLHIFRSARCSHGYYNQNNTYVLLLNPCNTRLSNKWASSALPGPLQIISLIR